MDDAQAAWEGIAADLHDATGCGDPPVDALELADLCGLELRRVDGGLPFRKGEVIYLPKSFEGPRLHGACAHETGHWAAERGGEENTERAARYLAGALLLPRQPFDRDLRETHWDLRQLRAKHINASAEMIARRIVNLRDAVCSIWDNGKQGWRIWSPWLAPGLHGQRATKVERELAERALETGEVVREDQLLWAFPIFGDDGWRRVIVIAEAKQLGMRF